MKNCHFSILAAAAVVSVGFCGGAAAQSLAPGLIECRGIGDDSDRLACFDRLAGGLEAEKIAVEATDGEAALASGPVLTPEERFGAEDLPETKEKQRKEREKIKSLAASVVDVGRNGRGKYVIILDNGQVWRQLSADTDKLRVPKSGAEGMGVTIKRKSFGGHVLSLNGDKRSIRVERIK
ncbi:MAG: hypothetical protein AAFX54_19095 [Pseudomonadota bacterium]